MNFLAEAVVRTIQQVSGRIPGRTWDPYANKEKGIGLAICRILAAALNDALPEGFRQSPSADMPKPFRNAIELVRATG